MNKGTSQQLEPTIYCTRGEPANHYIIDLVCTLTEREIQLGYRVRVFNATVNNISIISWQSVFLMKDTGAPGENHRPVAIHRRTLSHNVVSSTPRHQWDSN